MKKNYKKIGIGILSTFAIIAVGFLLNFPLTQLARAAVTNKIPTTIALYEDSLASAISSSATSFTLVRGTDIVGTSLATSTYGFIIDEGTASREFVLADCTATACTNAIRGVSPITGLANVPALQKTHRRGASVKMTDAPILLILGRMLNGVETIPNALSYVTHPTFSSDTQIIDKKYVSDTITGFTGTATTTTAGTTKLSVAPASAGVPIAVGDNDPRIPTSAQVGYIPTSGQKDALTGTSGTPSSSNKYVTNDDVSNAGVSSKIVRLSGTSYPAGNGSSLTDTGINTYTFGETITAGQALYLKESDGKVYKASASTSNEALYNYIGIAYEAGSANDSKKVYDKDGQIVSGLSLGSTTTSISSTAVLTQSDDGSTIGNLYASNFVTSGFFTTSTQANIEKVTVKFGANSGTGGGNVYMEIYKVTAFSGRSLTTSLVGTSNTLSPATPSATNTFTFTPFTVTPNTQYVVKLVATGGNSSNFYNVNRSNSTVSRNYWTGTTEGTITTNDSGLTMTIYSTSTYNYSVGDNIYLSDTAGGLSFTGGSMTFCVGRILSSSTILMGCPLQKKKMSSQTLFYNSGVFNKIPVPRNATSSSFDFYVANASWAGGYSNFDFEIGGVTTKKLSVNDGAGSSVYYNTATAGFGGSAQVSAATTVASVNSTDVVITFYR